MRERRNKRGGKEVAGNYRVKTKMEDVLPVREKREKRRERSWRSGKL